MTQYKSAIKNENDLVIRLSPNMIDTFSNFPHKLLLTDRQVSRIRKAFSIENALRILETCLSVNNNLCGKLLKVSIMLGDNLITKSFSFFIADLYCVILYY